MRIQIRLTLIDDTGLAMRVLEQEGVRRGCGKLWEDEDGDFDISSCDSPEMDGATLYVRGEDEDEDDALSLWVFDSPEDRTAWIEAIRRGITELNGGSRVTDIRTEIIG